MVVVKKFGGTSVGDIERIRNVAKLVAEHKKKTNDDVVLVVSAMAGETNKLVALAKSCVSEPDPRELDVLLATGEQVTIALLAMALNQMGVPAQSMRGDQARILTSKNYNNAEILGIDGDAIKAVLASGKIPVIAGFQGIDQDGSITTLGRGGSDITAVAVAAGIKADCCYIYTDVRGVYSTDPRICTQARLLSRVSHEEMLELASLGAKVLHPRSVFFAQVYGIPLVVLSTFEPEAGSTWIVKEEELMEKPVVSGITYRTDEAKITMRKIPPDYAAFSQIFSELADAGILVDMISQTGFEDGTTDLSFTVPDEQSAKTVTLCQAMVTKRKSKGVWCERDVAKVSAVGIGMRYHTGVAACFFGALAKEGVEVSMIGTSDIKISVIIPRKYCEVAVRALHAGFCEQNPVVKEEEA